MRSIKRPKDLEGVLNMSYCTCFPCFSPVVFFLELTFRKSQAYSEEIRNRVLIFWNIRKPPKLAMFAMVRHIHLPVHPLHLSSLSAWGALHDDACSVSSACTVATGWEAEPSLFLERGAVGVRCWLAYFGCFDFGRWWIDQFLVCFFWTILFGSIFNGGSHVSLLRSFPGGEESNTTLRGALRSLEMLRDLTFHPFISGCFSWKMQGEHCLFWLLSSGLE